MNGKVDWNFARDAVGDSIELLLELIEIFLEEYPKLIAGIESSIQSKEFVDLQRFAHTLKGSLRYFGETQAGQLSYELEVMARDQLLTPTSIFPIERATEAFGELQPELIELVSELNAFVASQSPEADA